MRKRRVLVLANRSLLMSGLLSLLRSHPEIELVTATQGAGGLGRHIRETAPDVVVMESPAGDEREVVSITGLLRDNPRAVLVTVSTHRPDMEVFLSDRIRGATVEGLLGIVDGAQRTARRARAPRTHLASDKKEGSR